MTDAHTAPDPLGWLDRKADRRTRAGLDRQLLVRKHDWKAVDFASNDYLGLAQDPRVIRAAQDAAQHWGAGATGSRLVSGSTALHEELEQALADLAGAPSALVFSSGYLANLAAVTALGGRDVLIVADAGNHASLIDACRLTNSRVVTVERQDLDGVARHLRDRTESRALVVVDAIGSVDGHLMRLADWYEASTRAGAILIVDDAHGIGVRAGGRGSVLEAGLQGAPDVVITATMSKALGSQGGVVMGDRRIIDHLINVGRTFIFDTGLNPPAVGAALAATQIVRGQPELALALLHRASTIAAAIGVPATDAAIVSLHVGDANRALTLSQELLARDIHVGCFRPPSVPLGEARLRLTANLRQRDEDIHRLRQVLDGLEVA